MIQLGTNYGLLPKAEMYASPFLKRLNLVKTRGHSYPLDNMDFILIDLEQPVSIRRHADFCCGDLSGRYLEMLAVSMPHDRTDEDRMHELFTRILKCQTRRGPFGKPFMPESGKSDEELAFTNAAHAFGTASKLFMGLLRYYLQTGNSKALTGARQNAEFLFKQMDYVKKYFQEPRITWISEPMALLYAITGDKRCLDICRMVANALPANINRTHSHSLMTTLRGLQLAAIYSGDLSFNEPVERFREEIIEKAVWADGNITEVFPMSGRNEGCSIADWVMLNLYSGFITGNNEAYEQAELAMYNALSLNTIVSGATGTRQLKMDRRGYHQGELSEECWWCCLHTTGLALAEYANHAVVLKDGKIQVNLLVPGRYTFDVDSNHITIDIASRYPETAETIILASGMPENLDLQVRIPPSVRNGHLLAEQLPQGHRRYTLSGDMGYYIEDVKEGVVLKYGPLVLVPLRYCSTNEETYVDFSKTSAPEGYIPPIMPKEYPAIVPSKNVDPAGFMIYDQEPWPVWQCYEEGMFSPLAYGELSINVPLYYPDGKVRFARFFPELNSTTTMVGFDLPVVFEKG